MHDFHEGLNEPSPVTRVLILGYSNGATNGVVQLGDGGLVYRFDLLDEAYNPDGLDERLFELRPLPSDALGLLEQAIGYYITPNWPTWLPIWRFPTLEIERLVGQQVDGILDSAGPATWRIVTTDTVQFQTLTAQPLRRETAVAV